jgi:hypothetical protein
VTPAPPDATERHRAPALWLVVASLAAATLAAVLAGARAGTTVLALTLAVAAVARMAGRGRRPEGIAVRSTWLDVLVLAALAVAVSLLMLTPGV